MSLRERFSFTFSIVIYTSKKVSIKTTQYSLLLVLIRSSYKYIKIFSIYRYSSFLDIIKTIIFNNKSYYSSNYISRYLLIDFIDIIKNIIFNNRSHYSSNYISRYLLILISIL